jgi:Ca-activated chloride channel homolog
MDNVGSDPCLSSAPRQENLRKFFGAFAGQVPYFFRSSAGLSRVRRTAAHADAELACIQQSPWYNRCLPYKLRPLRLSLVARSLVLTAGSQDMRHAFLQLVLAIGVLTGLAVKPQAQEPSSPQRETFRSAVDLVTIQASVKDAHGRIVNGLTTTDFEVRDNGQLRPILSLRSDRQSPLSLAILVDMSGSMGVSPRIAMARQAYDALLAQLHPGRDEVAVFTFDSSLHDRRDFTRDLASLRDALSEFEPFGTTSLYDATAATARQLATRSGTHKAIIVLTDGIDTSSEMTARDVSGLASSIDVPVFVVATVPSLDQRLMLQALERSMPSDAADLRDLAEWTGGQVVFATTLAETVAASTSLIDGLRQQYVIAIEAANGREWRRLDVRVRRPSTVVKARSGYFAG